MSVSDKPKPVCSHCGQVYGREPPKEGPRGIIGMVASQLLKWADESVEGGWSTHQVGPMRALAEKLSVFLVTGRVPEGSRYDAVRRETVTANDRSRRCEGWRTRWKKNI